ncbi:MAG: hypothetical protein DI626_02605 [Micavibrio aeruginosavorus]|uniref:Uncharacterized protein n=1 Tax=Micavibrio aeruginosavorus TaxID=349221 RepID=A0A2W5A0E9_9BACT|nr:MAG: hypothetical protein DI626_02605 [Micavibrio aeruginosavorus]
MKTMIFALALLISLPAAAYENVPPECRMIVKHIPDADVAYQEGVDVHGKAVAPADLNASPMADIAKAPIYVPLTVDMAQRIGGIGNGVQAEGALGFLEISPSGSVKYNDRDITGDVEAACAQASHGQAAKDAIKSGSGTNTNNLKK